MLSATLGHTISPHDFFPRQTGSQTSPGPSRQGNALHYSCKGTVWSSRDAMPQRSLQPEVLYPNMQGMSLSFMWMCSQASGDRRGRLLWDASTTCALSRCLQLQSARHMATALWPWRTATTQPAAGTLLYHAAHLNTGTCRDIMWFLMPKPPDRSYLGHFQALGGSQPVFQSTQKLVQRPFYKAFMSAVSRHYRATMGAEPPH